MQYKKTSVKVYFIVHAGPGLVFAIIRQMIRKVPANRIPLQEVITLLQQHLLKLAVDSSAPQHHQVNCAGLEPIIPISPVPAIAPVLLSASLASTSSPTNSPSRKTSTSSASGAQSLTRISTSSLAESGIYDYRHNIRKP